MSSVRFEKLKESKRKRIIEAAIDEFVVNGYDGASINGIIEKAGISRGSFYTYFTDKDDIFNYVIQTFHDKSSEFIIKTLIEEKGDLIDMIIKLYETHEVFTREMCHKTRALGLVKTVGEKFFNAVRPAVKGRDYDELLLFFQTGRGSVLCEKLQANSKEYLKKYSKEKFAYLVELLFTLGFKSVVTQDMYPARKSEIRRRFLVQLDFIRNGIERG